MRSSAGPGRWAGHTEGRGRGRGWSRADNFLGRKLFQLGQPAGARRGAVQRWTVAVLVQGSGTAQPNSQWRGPLRKSGKDFVRSLVFHLPPAPGRRCWGNAGQPLAESGIRTGSARWWRAAE